MLDRIQIVIKKQNEHTFMKKLNAYMHTHKCPFQQKTTSLQMYLPTGVTRSTASSQHTTLQSAPWVTGWTFATKLCSWVRYYCQTTKQNKKDGGTQTMFVSGFMALMNILPYVAANLVSFQNDTIPWLVSLRKSSAISISFCVRCPAMVSPIMHWLPFRFSRHLAGLGFLFFLFLVCGCFGFLYSCWNNHTLCLLCLLLSLNQTSVFYYFNLLLWIKN